MQLMIYVGGTLVLLIFGVMLTAQARFISMQTSAGEWILGPSSGVASFVLLVAAERFRRWNEPQPSPRPRHRSPTAKTSAPIGLA